MEIEKIFNSAGIPYTKVYDIKDVLEDPQVKERKGIIRLVDADLGSIPAPCVVPRVPGINIDTIKSGPKTGEDNPSFYKMLGLSEMEINDLKKDNII